ncbi:MAG: DUF2812 domain-containing protein [Senegalia sp. (in: firmicutes)]|uniref:DUF2812 domain-containing protein n=1 Tax=Senegalia sp. (in: firmicutes) TaxID=1924098 RepID=UPI003F96F981
MSKKITIHNLNVTNIPSVEKYLSEMASRGWMIKSIILASVFIFEKTEKQNLDFSITPYEIESAFNRKSKKEIEEFRDVTESVGWKFAAKSYDFHIYYKKNSEDLIELQTDEEEKFHAIKKIAKKELLSAYILIPFLLFFLWINTGIFFSVEGLVSGMYLFIVPMLIFAIVGALVQVIVYKIFLRKNKKNIEYGNDIEYSKTDMYRKFISIFIVGGMIFLILFIIYITYKAIRYKDIILFSAFIPGLVGLAIGLMYKYNIKPSEMSKKYKRIFFVVTLILAVVISNIIIFTDFPKFLSKEENKDYTYRENGSILIPEFYHYYTHGIDSVEIKYYDSLNESIAKRVVDLLLKERRNSITGSYSYALEELSENENALRGDYETLGLSKDEYIDLKTAEDAKTIDELIERNINDSIIKIENNIWNADEAYYLSINKDIALIRDDREVYYIGGYNLTDEKIIEEMKEELDI